jgi:exodeoxyribonuclease VIII
MTEYDEIKAMNWSSLRHLAASPLAYRWWTEHERPDSPAMRLGRAIHCAVLEPELFSRIYYVLPERPDGADGRGKAGSPGRCLYDDYWKAMCAVVPGGAEELRDADAAIVEAVSAAVLAHASAAAAIASGRHEVTLEWVDEASGVKCKGRLDVLGARVVDLKTTFKPLNARLAAIDVAQRLYHGQLAFYHDGAIAAGLLPRDAESPAIVLAQTTAPYDVGLAELGGVGLEAGRALYRAMLRRYVECRDTDWWPGALPDPVRLLLPEWAPGMAMAAGYHDPEWRFDDEDEYKEGDDD